MSVPDRPLRVGIIGTGWVAGDRHFPAYKRHPGAHVVAIYDRNRATADRFATARKVPYATDNFTDFLRQDLDLVSICTPPIVHHEHCLAALEAGCHVFLEKPMAMNADDARAMIAAAAQHDRLLCVSQNFLHSRSMRRLQRVLASGEVGPIQLVMGMQSSSPRRRLPQWYGELPGGLFFDESPHMLYLVRGVLGDAEVEFATASAAATGAQQPLSTVHIALRAGTVPATLTMTFESAVSEWHFLIFCQRKILMADLFRDVAVVLDQDGSHRAIDALRTSFRVGGQHLLRFAQSGGHWLRGRQDWGHGRLIHQTIDAAASGDPSPVPVEDALAVVQLTEEVLARMR